MTPLEHVAADLIFDDDHRTLAVAEGGHRWAVLQASPDTTLGELLNDLTIVEQLQAGNPGVVVVDNDGRPAGIVTRAVLLDYVRTRLRVAGTLLGDETLLGVPKLAPLILECSTCHARNELREFVEGFTACVNGHVLTVDWD
jgi:hypothetical protein